VTGGYFTTQVQPKARAFGGARFFIAYPIKLFEYELLLSLRYANAIVRYGNFYLICEFFHLYLYSRLFGRIFCGVLQKVINKYLQKKRITGKIDVGFHFCVPLGYPQGNFGPNVRKPTSATTFLNQWSAPVPWE